MTDGQNITREKYGKSVRISHAKAHGLLKGELIVDEGLPPELAQGLFAKPGTYPIVVRLATAPGEYTDDSKISTVRGMSVKVFNVEGPHLPPFEDITTQDFVFDTGKTFITSGPKAFLQAFKPNAEIAPKLSDDVKGVVSDLARGTNAVLNMFGANSEKLDFYGHEKKHPMAEAYFSQTPFRYGGYVAKIGFVPSTPTLAELAQLPFDPQTPDALREETVRYFKTNGARFDVAVQLSTDLETMPVEDPMVEWSEEESPYRAVAQIVIPRRMPLTRRARTSWTAISRFRPRTRWWRTVRWAASTGCGWRHTRRWPRCADRRTPGPRPSRRASSRCPRKAAPPQNHAASRGVPNKVGTALRSRP